MRIGYACLTVGVLDTDFKTFRKENLNENNLKKIIRHNLNSLLNIIEYNIKHEIKLFRISSDLIPFGSSVLNVFDWAEYFVDQFDLIGKKIKKHDMRVSMHPGQYTVLNSPSATVVNNAIADLAYHEKVLTALGLNDDHKIILHIGGVYKDKEVAIVRFIENYRRLDDRIKKRLVVENDDKSYNVLDVLMISEKLKIPVVYDYLHDQINPSNLHENPFSLIKRCADTWDETPKIHYSNQDVKKRNGSHSKRIDLISFLDFVMKLEINVDIMLEVKDKNISAVKCNNVIIREKKKEYLFAEWDLYRYKILECSKKGYLEIEKMLLLGNANFLQFYLLIDQSLEKQENVKGALKSVKKIIEPYLTGSEKKTFEKYGERISKNMLYQKVLKYDILELKNSYYFFL